MLLEPEQKHMCQLRGIAIDGVHASVSCTMHLPSETQHLLIMQLVRLSRKVSAVDLRSFLNNDKNLPLTKLELKGKSSWDDKIPVCTSLKAMCCSTDFPHVRIKDRDSSSDSSRIPISIMICPSCNSKGVADIAKLQQADLDIKIKCDNCCIRPPSRDWKCNCQVRWHTCLRHVCVTAIHKAKGKPNPITSKASKRLLKNATVGQLLDDDLQREPKLAKRLLDDDIITLEDKAPMASAIKPNMIPQSLKDRFPDAMRALGSQ